MGRIGGLGRLAPAAGVAAACAWLLVRLAPDVRGKPLFVDEAVAGLVGGRPLGEVLGVVLGDRGGAPAHFVLSGLVLDVHASPDALRWLSVACAVLTVPLAYDLARRLGGATAGVAAATVVAASDMLGVYGSFARMYALYALVGALAADLFVVALGRRTWRWALAAAAGAWLLPAVHPYGVFLLVAEAAVAAVLWRGRSLVPALPVAAVALATLPFALADRRLAERFAVGSGSGHALGPVRAARYLGHALEEFGGAGGLVFAACALIAAVGAWTLLRERTAVAVVVAGALAGPPILLVLSSTSRSSGLANLSTRHLVGALPLWAALLGVGLGRLLRARPPGIHVAVLALFALLLAVGPASGIRDPRTRLPLVSRTGERAALAAPARWLRGQVEPGDAVFYPSPAYLAAIGSTRHAVLLDPSPGGVLGRAARRLDYPVGAGFVAVPLGGAPLDRGTLRGSLGSADAYVATGDWLLIRVGGPFAAEATLWRALARGFDAASSAVSAPSPRLTAYLRSNRAAVCAALRKTGGACRFG